MGKGKPTAPFVPGDTVYFDYDTERTDPVTVTECKSAHARYTWVVTRSGILSGHRERSCGTVSAPQPSEVRHSEQA